MESHAVKQLLQEPAVTDLDVKLEKLLDDLTTDDWENEPTQDDKNVNPAVVMEVFSNELIWKTLGRCLNVSDLKCSRLVSRKLNQMVMDETKFKDRVVLKVKKNKLKPKEFGKTEQNWKKISLNFPVKHASSPSNYEWLYPLLTEAEFLSLSLHGNAPSPSIVDFHPLLGRLLESCKKLKSLALEPDFIRTGSSRISQGKETLENLEKLEILKPDYRRRALRGQEDTREQDWRMIQEFCDKLKKVKMYKSYCAHFRLSLSPLANAELGSKRTWVDAVFLHDLCDTVVRKNRHHLESHPFYDAINLSLPGSIYVTDFNFETPALIAVEADDYQLESFGSVLNLSYYLKRRPRIEQLDISCPFYDPMHNIVLSELMSAVSHHKMSLKKLKFWIRLEALSDWVFLRESSLQDLRLEDNRCENVEENGWIRQVMSNLPNSVEKLYLRGALLKRGEEEQKSLTEPLKIECFARLDPQLVTQLSIFNAGGLVDNQVAQFICKNFKLLRKFNLSHTHTNDEGFDEIGGLKGLQFLTLRVCGISDKTLKLIRFLELRYLDVAGNFKTTEAEIKMTMKECPSLETVVIPGREGNFTKEDGQKICPRLKFVMYSNDGFPDEP